MGWIVRNMLDGSWMLKGKDARRREDLKTTNQIKGNSNRSNVYKKFKEEKKKPS